LADISSKIIYPLTIYNTLIYLLLDRKVYFDIQISNHSWSSIEVPRTTINNKIAEATHLAFTLKKNVFLENVCS
jgi:hypothetical protein